MERSAYTRKKKSQVSCKISAICTASTLKQEGRRDMPLKKGKITKMTMSDDILSLKQFSILSRTPSGNLAIEIDDHIIDKIEQKTQHNPNILVSLKETKSGNYLIDFEDDSSNDRPKVMVKRTESGSLSLEIDKYLLERPSHLESKATKKSTQFLKKSNKNMKTTHNLDKRFGDKDVAESNITEINDSETSTFSCLSPTSVISDVKNQLQEEVMGIQNVVSNFESDKRLYSRSNLSGCLNRNKPSLLNYFNIFKDTLKGNKDKVVILTIVLESGITETTKAVVTTTTSGNVALDIKDVVMYLDRNVSLKSSECPAYLELSDFGKYVVTLQKACGRVPNSILRKTSSGRYLLILMEHDKMEKQNVSPGTSCATTSNKCREVYFKVKAKDQNIKLVKQPMLVKSTVSDNYILIFDKEFERYHKYEVCNKLAKSDGYPIVLAHEKDYVVVDFDIEETIDANAVLAKHASILKIYINGTSSTKETKSQKKQLPQRPGSHNITKLQEKLGMCECVDENCSKSQTYNNPSTSYNKSHQPNVEMGQLKGYESDVGSKSNISKSASDSNIYFKQSYSDKQAQALLLSGASVSLKKIDTGQYALMLNEESKVNFIKDLKDYLAVNTKGRTPIWKDTAEGEVNISLSDNDGSLKITPSGNIFVMVNENVVEQIQNNCENKKDVVEKVLKHIVGCVTIPTLFKRQHNRATYSEKYSTISFGSITDSMRSKSECFHNLGRYHSCDSTFFSCNTSSGGFFDDGSTSTNDSVHTIVRPNNVCFETVPKQCFFSKELIYNVYKKTHNDQIKVRGAWNQWNVVEKSTMTRTSESGPTEMKWDAIENMELQLPTFLKGVLKN